MALDAFGRTSLGLGRCRCRRRLGGCHCSTTKTIGKTGLTGVTVLAVIGLFAIARLAGLNTAHADFLEQRASDYSAYPRVEITASADVEDDAASAPAIAIAKSGCAPSDSLHKERLFLIRPVKGAPGLDLHTFVLPWSDVAALRITENYTSCD